MRESSLGWKGQEKKRPLLFFGDTLSSDFVDHSMQLRILGWFSALSRPWARFLRLAPGLVEVNEFGAHLVHFSLRHTGHGFEGPVAGQQQHFGFVIAGQRNQTGAQPTFRFPPQLLLGRIALAEEEDSFAEQAL